MSVTSIKRQKQIEPPETALLKCDRHGGPKRTVVSCKHVIAGAKPSEYQKPTSDEFEGVGYLVCEACMVPNMGKLPWGKLICEGCAETIVGNWSRVN